MNSLARNKARDLYVPELQLIYDYGDLVEVHGRKTKEMLNFISTVYEPEHHCILVPSRIWNPWLAMSEGLWILAGRSDVAALKPYNRRIMNYSDDGVELYGAYGARMWDQIDDLIDRLRKDPSDRRAVLQIWDAPDLTTTSKDPPCNDMVMFKLRDNKLHMTVLNRSNDIHWGLFAVNLPTFGMLQEYIAARLNVDLGVQTHFSNSLHMYIDDPAAESITQRMLFNEVEDVPAYPKHSKMFDAAFSSKKFTHYQMSVMCNAVLNDEAINPEWPDIFHYAKPFLRAYREKDLGLIPEDPCFADWTMAAQMFAKRVWK